MKKIFTLLSACALAFAGSSQTYFSDDWTGGTLTSNNAWTTYTTDVSYDWVASDLGTSGNFYARMTNYDGANNHVVTAWLLSPALDLTSATNPYLSFDNAYNFTGDPLEVMVSTDFTGSGDPSVATWTDLSGSTNWSGGSFAFTNSGDIDLTSHITATTYIAFKYTGSATDGSTWEIDDLLIQEGLTVTTITPIYDIQYSLTGDSPELGNDVTTKGVVTGIYLFGGEIDRFFIQDSTGAWNGIFVYENGYTVNIGDSVLVSGEVLEFNSLTELGFVTDVQILNSGNTLPAPVMVTSATIGDEEYEGVRVTLSGAVCTQATDGFGTWQANDGTAASIKIDDDLLATTFQSTLGDGYDVTGIRHYAFSENLLYPTTSADITTVGFSGLEDNALEFTVYPNPATDEVIVNAAPNALVAIYSMTGAVVAKGISNKSIDVSALDAGLYQVVISENGMQSTQKLIIR